MYLEALAPALDVLAAAPAPDWGIVVTTVGQLRALGFKVSSEPVADQPLGDAHVSIEPPDYDEDGQIPLELLTLLANEAEWLVRPG
jgi:hypothetical protein